MDVKEDPDAYDDAPPSGSGLGGEGPSGSGVREEGSGNGPRKEGPGNGPREEGPGSGPREGSPGGKGEAGEQEECEEEEAVNDPTVDPTKEKEAVSVGTKQVAKDDHKGGAKSTAETTPPLAVIPGTLDLHIPPDNPEEKGGKKEPKDTPKSVPAPPNVFPPQTLDPEVPMKTADNPADGPEARSSSTHGIHPPAVQSKLA